MRLRFLNPKNAFLIISLAMLSCQKESLPIASTDNSTTTTTPATVPKTTTNPISTTTTTTTPVPKTVTPAVKADTTNIITVNWNNRTNGAPYTSAMAAADFTNISGGWNQNLAYTTTGKNGVGLRATLLPNTLTGEGLYGSVNIPTGTQYEMDYDVEFDPNFNWGEGGKIGFGFLVGEGNTGGNPAWDGNGGSLRIMWYSPGINPDRVYFEPYLYYKDQNGGPSSGNVYGDTMGVTYPTSGSLAKGQWYHVHMYIKSNTDSNTDGQVQIVINGTTVLNQAIRWTTNDAERLINTLTFNTFRGGATTDWETSSTDYVYYDNLSVNMIN